MKKLFTSSGTLWSCLIALVMMMAAQSALAQYVPLTALAGTGGTGGEGYPKLVDMLDGRDGRAHSKWGQGFNSDNGDIAWIIVKASKAVVPDWYFLVIGNDTGNDPNGDRNWDTYNIYAANFDSDDDATYDSESWVLVDERESANLIRQNYGVDNRTFNKSDGKAYRYFMIVITKCVATSTYMQMEEWGLGSHDDFQYYLANPETDVDEPVKYTAVEGSYSGSLAKLFDGQSNTKWEGGFTNRADENDLTKGAYFIMKASRSICPTYYCLRTGGDTRSYKGRNWKQWRIYGMNATSNPSRDAAGWKLLDSKSGIGPDQLLADNLKDCYFAMSEENQTEYRYFKVEIDSIVKGNYQQMDEFSLIDGHTLQLIRNDIIDALAYNPDVFAEKVVIDAMAPIIEAINASSNPVEINELNKQATEQKAKIDQSAKEYAEMTTARNQALIQLADGNVADEAITYVQNWTSDTDVIAPSDEYPIGNYAHVKATRLATGEEVVAEAKRFLVFLLGNANQVDAPLKTNATTPGFYTRIAGSGGFGGEGDEMLYDGIPREYTEVNPESGETETHKATKWCTNGVSPRTPAWTIFQTGEPIKPTYYGLVTGNDTKKYYTRNWKTWKIWGANFSDDETPDRNSDKWVLIDDKFNVGNDVLHAENAFESYIYLSEGCAEAYQYFKIEVYEAVSGDLIQMNEFTFYNQGNFVEYRQAFINEFADYDADSRPAYPGYIADFKTKYEELCNAASAPDLMSIKNEVQDLKDQVESSVKRYEQYEEVYEQLLSTGAASENLEDWFNGYTTENVGPNAKYINGTHDYIVENHSLDNKKLGQKKVFDEKDPRKYDPYNPASGEIGYIQNMIDAKNEGLYILIGGNSDNEFGDGFYGHLIDGVALNDTVINIVEERPDTTIYLATKWGTNTKEDATSFTDTYVIFRTAEPTNPYFYTLTTGNDTQKYYQRNWGTWYIYGANFEGDGEATKDAEGWVLIDSKEKIGQDRLHAVNAQPSYFGFSSETEQEYIYYKVVVTDAYSGGAIQMNELHFGTEDEFDVIKTEYIDKANEFDYNLVAYQGLIDEYEAKIDSIGECVNMEVLFRLNAGIEALKPQITASAAVYASYKDAVDAAKAYLEENELADCEEKTIFENYLNTNEAPDEEEGGLYPNGTAPYILDMHMLPDSVVVAEVEFLANLQAAAVAAGYGKGTDVSSLIVNRTFATAGPVQKDEKGNDVGRIADGWDGYIFRTGTDDAATVYGAEFCNYLAKFDISQTLTGMNNGFYKVTLNAAYRSNGDLLCYNYAPMAYANDVKTFIPVIREDAYMGEDSLNRWKGNYPDRAFNVVNVDQEEETLWGMWGCEGAAHAFRQGHYPVTLVAQVTDGTLKIGLKNEGLSGNEWTGAGNFGLWYLGETEEDAAVALQEAADYNAERINTLIDFTEDPAGDTYSMNPGFSAEQQKILEDNSGVPTYAAAKLIGETMQAIYEIKPAYAELNAAADRVYDKWQDAEADVYVSMETDINDIEQNLLDGFFKTPEDALAAKAQLYANWPGYLQLKTSGEGVASAENVDIDVTNFEFTLETTGNQPYLELFSLYEPLEKDEIVLSFDYTAEQDIENGYFYYMNPTLKRNPNSAIPTLPAAAEWTTVYYNITEGIEALGFGSARDHGVRWYINYGGTSAEPLPTLKLQARNFRIITVAQMEAENGKLLIPFKGDINGDNKVDISLIANGVDNPAADLNGDGKVDISDAQKVLIIIANQ